MFCFFWKQTKKSDKTERIDKGVIEAILLDKALPVTASEDINRQMKKGSIYQNVYIVDATTLVVSGKIVGYRITRLIDILPQDEPLDGET
ncbi:MAG: hypothetical protein LBP89_06945 [Helicobacteraceae bacterium]|jgi:hypothetical protein|nr:hypothetical protein [Helicobacteraceae bacterium]